VTQMLKDEALIVLASAIDETHDGLAHFTDRLKEIDDIPAFWWGDYPVWVSERKHHGLSAWPLSYDSHARLSICCPAGKSQYIVQTLAVKAFAARTLKHKLTDAEFSLLLDLATGLSVEGSAHKANVEVSTRRKQLQMIFRKLDVVSQVELISLVGQLVARFSSTLSALCVNNGIHWGDYTRHLPTGVRCGILQDADHGIVRYLEIGPVTGQTVIILHPMIFPEIDQNDVALFDELGWRTLWPIRTGCLSVGGSMTKDWSEHFEKSASDIRAIQQMCVDGPVLLIALVSSGAYATRFAERFPNCVKQIDFVSTCFSSGKGKSRDGYFGDFLLRGLRQNGRLAAVAIQHLVKAAFVPDQLEKTLRRIFRGSPKDQEVLDHEFNTSAGTERVTCAIRQSVASMRMDYLSQLNFCWTRTKQLGVSVQFWHGAQDTVHPLSDMTEFSQKITCKPPKVIAEMGHLTQGKPLRETFRKIAATYSK
jgi:DNA-binding CsgD family transcriptional regulator